MKTSSPTIFQWDYWFGQVDSLPVVLFRICFGALLCKNALYLLPLGQLFFGDDGITPRAPAWQDPAQYALGQFSIFNYVAAGWLASIIFGVWAAVAVALIVGYHARTMAILNFLLWLSLLHRNPFILHGPDHVMFVLSFWLIFLPLDRRIAFAFPLRAVQVQIALIYLFTGYYKWQGAYWRQGDALSYVLQQNSFLAPTGAWFAAVAPLWLLHLLTWSTLGIELGFVLLVFAPFLQPWAKAVGLALAALLHLGIALTMAIPDFSLVMVIAYLLFLEPGWVAWLVNRAHRLLRFTAAPLVSPPALGRSAVEQDGRRLPRWIGSLPIGRAVLASLLASLLVAAALGGLGAESGDWSAAAAAQPLLVRAVNRELHLASPWAMFVYRSRPRTGWMMVVGSFENGARQLLYTSVDPATGTVVQQWGPAARLRFFEQRLLWSFPATILHAWGAYYCHAYNQVQAPPAGRRLAAVAIVRRARWTHAPAAADEPYQDDVLWRQRCLPASAAVVD
jgi:hypothetical protein